MRRTRTTRMAALWLLAACNAAHRQEAPAPDAAVPALILAPDGEVEWERQPGQPAGEGEKWVVNEVIMAHIGRIRRCYQRGLRQDPTLQGKVTVRFAIAGDGSVPFALTADTTLRDPGVESCINGEIMRLEFPEPGGGRTILITYPFVLSPG